MNHYHPHPHQHSPQPQPQPQPQAQPQPARGGIGGIGGIAVPSRWDVLNGRGQGVQRYPGNVKYRTLVFANKGLYAKCPRMDKIKISKGIVAAIREVGGGFLEQDERTGLYFDIGDKKATEKTSQALREGQKKIRKQIYREEETMDAETHEQLRISDALLRDGRGISDEGYFGYSVQLLESLGNVVGNVAKNKNDRPTPASADLMPDAGMPGPPPLPSAVKSNHSVAMTMDQYHRAAPSVKQEPSAEPYALPKSTKQEFSAKPYKTGILPPLLTHRQTQQSEAHLEMWHGTQVTRDFSTGGVDMAMDQFPGAARMPPAKQEPGATPYAPSKPMKQELGAKPYRTGTLPPPLPRQQLTACPEMMHGFSTGGVGKPRRHSSSIDRMLESTWGGGPKQAPTVGQRAAAKSVLSDEIHNLILMSAPQLKMVENRSLTRLVDGVEEAHGATATKDAKDAETEWASATKNAKTDEVSTSAIVDLSGDGGGEGKGGGRTAAAGKNMDDAQLLMRLSDSYLKKLGRNERRGVLEENV